MPNDVMKAILSIQSEVAYGHVGNSAAVLPLQRLGFEVWPVNTVQLGHHPGYGRFSGHRVEHDRLAVILDGVLDEAPLDTCVGLLVGYLGDGAVADLVLRALDVIQARRPDLTFLLDPVIGDDGSGIFVRPDVPEAIADKLLSRATIVTPNRFELAHLSGSTVDDLDQATEAAQRLLACGPALVVATGLPDLNQPDQLAMLAVSQNERWVVRTPKLARAFCGTGDAFAAMLLGQHLLAPDVKSVLERAASTIFSLVERTAERDEVELSLVSAQDVLAASTIRFSAERL